MRPTILLQQVTYEIIGMQTLHDDNNRTLGFVIQPRQQRVGIPLLEGIPGALRLCILWLQRVVDNDKISAAPGQGAADRSCEPRASRGRHHLGFGILDGTNSSGGKYATV